MADIATRIVAHAGSVSDQCSQIIILLDALRFAENQCSYNFAHTKATKDLENYKKHVPERDYRRRKRKRELTLFDRHVRETRALLPVLIVPLWHHWSMATDDQLREAWVQNFYIKALSGNGQAGFATDVSTPVIPPQNFVAAEGRIRGWLDVMLKERVQRGVTIHSYDEYQRGVVPTSMVDPAHGVLLLRGRNPLVNPTAWEGPESGPCARHPATPALSAPLGPDDIAMLPRNLYGENLEALLNYKGYGEQCSHIKETAQFLLRRMLAEGLPYRRTRDDVVMAINDLLSYLRTERSYEESKSRNTFKTRSFRPLPGSPRSIATIDGAGDRATVTLRKEVQFESPKPRVRSVVALVKPPDDDTAPLHRMDAHRDSGALHLNARDAKPRATEVLRDSSRGRRRSRSASRSRPRRSQSRSTPAKIQAASGPPNPDYYPMDYLVFQMRTSNFRCDPPTWAWELKHIAPTQYGLIAARMEVTWTMFYCGMVVHGLDVAFRIPEPPQLEVHCFMPSKYYEGPPPSNSDYRVRVKDRLLAYGAALWYAAIRAGWQPARFLTTTSLNAVPASVATYIQAVTQTELDPLIMYQLATSRKYDVMDPYPMGEKLREASEELFGQFHASTRTLPRAAVLKQKAEAASAPRPGVTQTNSNTQPSSGPRVGWGRGQGLTPVMTPVGSPSTPARSTELTPDTRLNMELTGYPDGVDDPLSTFGEPEDPLLGLNTEAVDPVIRRPTTVQLAYDVGDNPLLAKYTTMSPGLTVPGFQVASEEATSTATPDVPTPPTDRNDFPLFRVAQQMVQETLNRAQSPMPPLEDEQGDLVAATGGTPPPGLDVAPDVKGSPSRPTTPPPVPDDVQSMRSVRSDTSSFVVLSREDCYAPGGPSTDQRNAGSDGEEDMI